MVRMRNCRTARLTNFPMLVRSSIQVHFQRMAPGGCFRKLMAACNTTSANLGALAAIYFCVYAAMQLPSGVLADTQGAGTYRPSTRASG